MLEHSLIDEGMFHATGADGAVACLSLPQVLARLSAGEDLRFNALRPHQQAPWHAFLVQLAYLALQDDVGNLPQPPVAATPWVGRLRALTPDHSDDGPWCLINTDWQQPAFLQPPCSATRVADFKHSSDGAQDIDVLVTARHHDEKSGKLPLAAHSLDALVYALCTLQGMTPGLGRGNYNSMRVNGYYGSRPQFRLAFERGTGREFLRDLKLLLQARGDMATEFLRRHPGGDLSTLHRLLWLPPWDEGSLPLSAVHPLCLEICRRVRLVGEGQRLQLRRASSNAMRVAAKDAHGNVMDPWTPIVQGDEPKALTAQPHSLGYRNLQSLLFDRARYRMPMLAEPSQDEERSNQPATLIAQVLVSGEGGTDGLLKREVMMPAPVLVQMRSAAAALAQRSQRFVVLAGLASGKVLRSALIQFVDGGDEVDWKNRDFSRAVATWLDRYEQAIDDVFFVHLFESVAAMPHDDSAAENQWVAWLADAAGAHLAAASQALPTRDGSRQFARARAQRQFNLSLRKHLGAQLPTKPMNTTTDTEEVANG